MLAPFSQWIGIGCIHVSSEKIGAGDHGLTTVPSRATLCSSAWNSGEAYQYSKIIFSNLKGKSPSFHTDEILFSASSINFIAKIKHTPN